MIYDHTVILSETRQTYDLTPHVDDLQFGNADPGGYGAVAFDLDRAVNAEEFESFAYIAVYDASTGEQVGGGRMSNPGRGFNDRGEGVWKMTALGEGLASTQERKVPYFLIDSRLESFRNGASTSVNRSWAVGEVPNPNRAEDGLVLTINQTTIGTDAFSNCNFYDLAQYPNQRIGGVFARHRAGRDSTGFDLEWQLRGPGGGPNFDFLVQDWERAERSNSREIGTHWDNTINYQLFNFVAVRDGGTHTVDTSLDYYTIQEARIQSVRLDRSGNEIIGGMAYTRGGGDAYVLAEEAIIDVLARYCPRLDLVNARIDLGVYRHTQLVYPDGGSPHDVLTYLMSIEADYTWAAYEKQDNGLWRFEWRNRSSEDVRYEIDENALTSFELTGGEEEELTKFYYTGTTSLDQYRTNSATVSNPTFERLNIRPTDTEPITLESLDRWEWEAAAGQAAAAQLVASRYRALACRATVEGVVYDRFKRRWVKVSQMEPGYLAAFTPVDAGLRLSDEGEFNPVQGFIKRHDYSDSSRQAVLEVNSPTVDEMRALAELMSGRRDVR